MNARERGFLLLTSHLGDPDQKVLTVAQMRLLAGCVSTSDLSGREGNVTAEDLMAMGYNRPSAQRIVELLSREEQLQWYLQRAMRCGCTPITRVSENYPLILRKRLGLDSPGSLWAKGDMSLLDTPAVALVGSRDLGSENEAFARCAGRQAALQGFTLVSGNARGADRIAQESCLTEGGSVISVVADSLESHPVRANVLYLSEDGFDQPFSAQRALQRNRIIHALGWKTFVAQSGFGKGGTWSGTVNNLRHDWSPVFCFDDSSEAVGELARLGAKCVGIDALEDISALQPDALRFMDL